MKIKSFLEDSVAQFKDYLLSERNLSDNTVLAYHTDIVQFVHFLIGLAEENETTVDIFDIDHIDEFIIYLSQSSFENSSIQRKISAIALYLKFLKLEKIIKENPSRFLIRPKSGSKLPAYLSVEEVEKFINSFNLESVSGRRDRALYELMYSCGLRVSEVVSLHLEDVFFEERIVKVTGKGDKQRLVPIGQRAIEALKNYIVFARPVLEAKAKKRTSILFMNYRGDRLSRKGIWKNLKVAAMKIGIQKEFTVHTLRHSFATHLVQNGADIRYVQNFLGHQNINTTEIYTHLDMKHIKEVYDRSQSSEDG